MRLLATILMLLALVLPWQANASTHETAYAEIADTTGITIAPLEHGQMLVIDANRSAIMALAANYADDPVIAKLTAYGNAQYKAALFGLWPKALADAETPFHLPTHAYLAAARATLVRLTDIAPASPAVQQLAANLDRDMIMQHSTSLSLCIDSATAFSTTTLVGPDWSRGTTGAILGTVASPRFSMLLTLLLGLATFALVVRSLVLRLYKRQSPRFHPFRNPA